MRFRLSTLLFLMISIGMAFAWWADANQRSTPLYLHSYPDSMSSEGTTYTILLRKNESFLCETNLYGPQINGRLATMSDGSLHIFLHANNLGGTGFTIERSIELDQPFGPTAFITGGSFNPYDFVLSKETDIEKILEQLQSENEQP